MKEIELTSKAEVDLVAIWKYSFRQMSLLAGFAAEFDVLATRDIGTQHSELGEDICSLPVAQYMIYFLPPDSVITIIRVLSQSQDTMRHAPWR